MKLMKNTFLFEYQDKSINLKDKLLDYNNLIDKLDNSFIEDDLSIIQKRYFYPTKNKVIDELYRKNRIILLHNVDRIKIPTCIPSFLYNLNGNVVAMTNLTNYGVKKGDHLSIDTRQLFAQLQSAVILLGCHEDWNSVFMNQAILKNGAIIFSKLFAKVLDKMYALNVDPIKTDKVLYQAAKYFLLNIMEKNNLELVVNVSYSACKNNTTKNTILLFDQEFDPMAYSDINTFITELANKVPGFSSLNMRSFLDNWIRMYGASTIMALEYFPMFCYMLFSVVVGARVNQEFLIENTVGNLLDKFYNDVVNVICR